MKLAHERVAGDEGSPEVWVLHGILGAGRNWRAFSRRLGRALPGLSFVVIDHRGHGGSRPAPPPPHTLGACADDLVELAAYRGAPPHAVVGHSFGGKVALAYGVRAGEAVRRVWVLDSVPGPQARLTDASRWQEHEVGRVLLALEAQPGPFPDLASAAGALAAEGLSPALVAWLTTGLGPAEGGLGWRLELDVVRALLLDHARTDAWPWVHALGARVRLLRAGRSDRWTGEDGEAFDELARRGQAVELPDAGHWVHVDAPDALEVFLTRDLSGSYARHG